MSSPLKPVQGINNEAVAVNRSGASTWAEPSRAEPGHMSSIEKKRRFFGEWQLGSARDSARDSARSAHVVARDVKLGRVPPNFAPTRTKPGSCSEHRVRPSPSPCPPAIHEGGRGAERRGGGVQHGGVVSAPSPLRLLSASAEP